MGGGNGNHEVPVGKKRRVSEFGPGDLSLIPDLPSHSSDPHHCVK